MRIHIIQMKRQEALPIEQNSTYSRLQLPGRQTFLSFATVVVILIFSPEISGAARAVRFRDTCSAAKSPFMPMTLSPLRDHNRGEYHNAATPFCTPQRPHSLLANIKPRVDFEVHPLFWSVRKKSQEQHWYHQHKQQQRQLLQIQHQRHGGSSPLGSSLRPTTCAYSNFSSKFSGGWRQHATHSQPLFLTFAATVAQTVQTQQRWLSSRQLTVRARKCRPSTVTTDGAMRTSRVFNPNVPNPSIDTPSDAEVSTAFTSDVCATVPSIIQPNLPVQVATERPQGGKQHPATTALRKKKTLLSSSIDHISRQASPYSGDRTGVEEQRTSNTAVNTGLAAPAGMIGKKLLSLLPRCSSEESSCSRRILVGEAVQEEAVTAELFPFPRLGLFPNFVEALRNLGVRTATEIQQLCLPAILSGADVVLGAETGSGKTLGYLLGVLQNVLIQKMIHERREDEAMMRKDDLPLPRHYPYAIVVVPTRELAMQVGAWSRRLCKKTPISTQLLLGSYTRWPFGTLTLPTSPDVIVCTPQVLAGFAGGAGCRKKHISIFEQTHMLVLDEADMLLEGGYKKMMESVFLQCRKTDKILASSGKRRTQYLFAAATIPERGPMSIRKIITGLCPEARFLCTDSLHRQRRELQQEFIEIPAHASFDDRIDMLADKLREIPLSESVLIFCNTAQTAKQVVEILEEKLPFLANPKIFSSDLDQKDRTRNLGLFARQKSKVLVCTDAASRGLDIVGVTNVIQFDFALNAMTHLHRVGRVARAGKFGKAINFYDPVNKPLVDIVREAACDPTRRTLADAFSRKRSFRKNLKKTEDNSVALVLDYPSPAAATPASLQGADKRTHHTEQHAAQDEGNVASGSHEL